MTAVVLIATPCTKSLGVEGGRQKHGGNEGCKLCCKFATVSWSGGGEGWVLAVGGRRHFDDDVYYIFAGD